MNNMIDRKWAALAVAALVIGGCDLEVTDPNSPNESEIITNAAGLRNVGVGLQAEYGNELVDPVYISSLVTDEIGAISAAFEGYRLVDAGLAVDNDVGPSTETWAGQFDVISVANVLLENVPKVTTLQPGTASGLTALAKLFKAMAFGNLLLVYERIPLEVGLENTTPSFATRAEGMTRVLTLLNEARQGLLTTPVSAEFTTTVIAPGFNLANTIDAMIARYSLINGDLAGALAAAQRVDLNVFSEFRFAATDPNPLWNMWSNSGNSVRMRPEDRWRLAAEANDRRVAYFVTASTTNIASNTASPLDDFVKYSSNIHSFPAYLPDEMRLIMAEVYARQNNLPLALIQLNTVRTQCTSAFDEPIACLPAYTAAQLATQQAMLDAILREREYELYLSGLRWSDLRRFGRPVKYQFMSVSRAECVGNPNVPQELCVRREPGM
jgi:starch-binding outer membrane protein, SusD/RagB family